MKAIVEMQKSLYSFFSESISISECLCFSLIRRSPLFHHFREPFSMHYVCFLSSAKKATQQSFFLRVVATAAATIAPHSKRVYKKKENKNTRLLIPSSLLNWIYLAINFIEWNFFFLFLNNRCTILSFFCLYGSKT